MGHAARPEIAKGISCPAAGSAADRGRARPVRPARRDPRPTAHDQPQALAALKTIRHPRHRRPVPCRLGPDPVAAINTVRGRRHHHRPQGVDAEVPALPERTGLHPHRDRRCRRGHRHDAAHRNRRPDPVRDRSPVRPVVRRPHPGSCPPERATASPDDIASTWPATGSSQQRPTHRPRHPGHAYTSQPVTYLAKSSATGQDSPRCPPRPQASTRQRRHPTHVARRGAAPEPGRTARRLTRELRVHLRYRAAAAASQPGGPAPAPPGSRWRSSSSSPHGARWRASTRASTRRPGPSWRHLREGHPRRTTRRIRRRSTRRVTRRSTGLDYSSWKLASTSSTDSPMPPMAM